MSSTTAYPQSNEEASPSEPQEVMSIPTFYGFQKLPSEVRRLIYAESLVRGKIYIACERYEDPPEHLNQGITAGLLQGVSKVIQQEAEDVFYSAANHFIVPVGTFRYPIDIGNGGILGPVRRSLLYQSMSYSFDMRQVDIDQYTIYHETKENYDSLHKYPHDFDSLTPEEKRSGIHEYHKQVLLEAWEGMCETITERLIGLQFLQLDFENCRCPMGCCRMLKDVCECLAEFSNGFPQRLEVSGVHGLREISMVRNMIGRSGQAEWIEFA